MKTRSQTTYILLDRGIEDVELIKELQALIAELGGLRLAAMTYPRLAELYGNLCDEVRAQNGGDT